MIKLIEFSIIKDVWAKELWPGRQDIDTHSAMSYNRSGYFHVKNFQLPAFYLAKVIDNEIVGVNSGHSCVDETFRSRGLWVNPKHRGKGIGSELLQATISLAENINHIAIWSFPRKTSWSTYERAGFILGSDWMESETSEANAFCIKFLN